MTDAVEDQLPSASEIELLSALNELHQADIARRASRIAVERAEDLMLRTISINLHEDVEHTLVTTRARLHTLRDQIDDEKIAKTLTRLEEGLAKAVTRMQRHVLEVRPPALERNGLGGTLRAFLTIMKSTYDLDFELTDELHREPDTDVQVTLFRIAQEAIDNTRKYAEAHRIEVSLREYGGGFLLRVADDGRGFNMRSDGGREKIGLAAMAERAEVRDGWCQLESTEGQGTSIEVWIPAGSRYEGS